MSSHIDYIKQKAEFAKHTSTAFIVASPFQVLCVVEAIAEFGIDDYLVVAILEEGDVRNSQLLQMLNDFTLKYVTMTLYDTEAMLEDFLLDKNYFSTPPKRLYDRVMMGDYFSIEQRELCYLYANSHATVLYMDDGATTIELLKGNTVQGKPLSWYEKRKWMKRIYKPTLALRENIHEKWKTKGILPSNSLFSIYHDISTRKFSVYPNTLTHINKESSNIQERNGVYIVGTNIPMYCKVMGIAVPQYEGILWQKLSEIRETFPNEEIIYIPHGRDENRVVMRFCEMLRIKYNKLNEAVEYHFICMNIYPSQVYGFGSTALFTLKKIYPKTKVTNWLLVNTEAYWYGDYKSVALYYDSHGITTEKIIISCFSLRKYLSNIFKPIFRKLKIVK